MRSITSMEQSLASNGDSHSTRARSVLPTEQLLAFHRSATFDRAGAALGSLGPQRKKSGEMDEHIKRMLSKWYFEDTIDKKGDAKSAEAFTDGSSMHFAAIKKNEAEIKNLKARAGKMEEVRLFPRFHCFVAQSIV